MPSKITTMTPEEVLDLRDTRELVSAWERSDDESSEPEVPDNQESFVQAEGSAEKYQAYKQPALWMLLGRDILGQEDIAIFYNMHDPNEFKVILYRLAVRAAASELGLV